MHKSSYFNMLRAQRRAGFSLAELIVAVAVLALMLALAGQVFSLTLRSTGQATALTEVNQMLRNVERTMREDLKYVEPGNTVLVIVGNPVNAYWTQAGREADDDGQPDNGYPLPIDPERERATGLPDYPRADMLMFFTGRQGESTVYTADAATNAAQAAPVTSQLQQVTYGHAVLGDYLADGLGGYTFSPGPDAFPADPADVSQVPAEMWHLTRRAVLLSPNPSPGYLSDPGSVNPPWPTCFEDTPDPNCLAHPNVLNGSCDVVADFNFVTEVLAPGTVSYHAAFPFYLPSVFDDPADINVTVLPRRSEIDETLPSLLGRRVGHYLLPKCASFKVEWTIDPRGAVAAGRLDGESEVYWFDPGNFDPVDSAVEHEVFASLDEAADRFPARATELRGIYQTASVHSDGQTYSLEQRFSSTDSDFMLNNQSRTNAAIFTAQRMDTGGALVPEDVFPTALRVTIDVFDPERRLERPMRHVMIIPVGQ